VNPDWKKSFTYTNKLLGQFQNKIKVVPNGVDTSLFKQVGKKEKSTILFVSILDKYHVFKGFDYLLNALPIIRKTMPDFKLKVIGEGELKVVYQKIVKQMGFSKHVLFVGEKNQQELPKYFSAASVFVLPSIHTEGYGIVLLESLACKTPVVTTSIAGLSTDIRKYEAGRIVEPENEKELASALLQLLQSNKLRLAQGINGRKLVESKYSWVKIADEITSLYTRIIR
jgi:glycosyltransferase involved in cell wall biosynthesis